MKKIKNVLSLFDGAGIGCLALKETSISFEKYFASEIDKKAISVSKKHHPEIIHLGDVTKWKEWDIDFSQIDLLIGGSPCQGFSTSGKGLNFNDPRSKLFFEFVDILNHIKSKNPMVKFMLENVVMKKKEWEDTVSSHLGVPAKKLNSRLTSAQNRERLYWANFDITEPDDRGVCLNDIIEDKYMPNKASIIGRRLNKNGHREDYNKSIPITQCLEVRATNRYKSNCLTTVAKDTVLTNMPIGRHIDVYGNKIPYRDYTPAERCRLMSWPENYLDGLKYGQIVKITGNGWELEMVKHIFMCLFY